MKIVWFHFTDKKVKTLKFKYSEEDFLVINDLVVGPERNPFLQAQHLSHYIWGGVGADSMSVFSQLFCKFIVSRDRVFTVRSFIGSFTLCCVETLGGGGGQEGLLAQASLHKGLHIGLNIAFEW